jgi:hypothetical protein
MSSPFQKKFCGKTPDPIKMLGDLNKDGKMSSYEQTRQDAIEANSPNNYGSPLEQQDDKSYFDSITKLPGVKGRYKEYVKRKKEGYTDPEDGYIKPSPENIITPERFAVSVEIGKGGKSGVKGLKAIRSDLYKMKYKDFVKNND